MRLPFFAVALLLATLCFLLPWDWASVLGGVLVILGLGTIPRSGFLPLLRSADSDSIVGGSVGDACDLGSGSDGGGCDGGAA
ncbi:hypothetical protein [Deinococcus sp. NW-56]|uniref:hypothetical protein n=1 Tax=Deinococcus sp. NW-56 TaxID=2080419 RepID=UPI000CF40930|nr:hypothetical protein [Deinococcus sp. NW-56]